MSINSMSMRMSKSKFCTIAWWRRIPLPLFNICNVVVNDAAQGPKFPSYTLLMRKVKRNHVILRIDDACHSSMP